NWQILQSDRTYFLELPGSTTDIQELLPSHIAAGQRELHAGEYISIRRDIAGGMPGAARVFLEIVRTGRTGRKAELVEVSDQRLVVKNAIEFMARNSESEN